MKKEWQKNFFNLLKIQTKIILPFTDTRHSAPNWAIGNLPTKLLDSRKCPHQMPHIFFLYALINAEVIGRDSPLLQSSFIIPSGFI
jgi:hypothetical protein